jgi:hypothetical protein
MSVIPTDTIILRSFDEWVLYFSLKERTFYIKTLDYHPEPLRLPVEVLYGMLADIEKIIREGKAGEDSPQHEQDLKRDM